MSKTLELSDELFERLQAQARDRGLGSVDELLESWPVGQTSPHGRKQTVESIDALRQRLLDKYGPMPDSVSLIREDRER